MNMEAPASHRMRSAGISHLRGEIAGRDGIIAIRSAWEDLCARAAEDNVYYSPPYALALLDTVEQTKDVRAVLAWDGDDLIGFFPFERPRLPGLPGRAWQSAFTFSCMPLLDKARATRAAGIILDILASAKPREWLIPRVNVDGPACAALTLALADRRSPWLHCGAFQRASLTPGLTFDAHVAQHVGARRRKDLARNRRRLSEMGDLRHEVFGAGPGFEAAVDAFLKLEASGWKGRSGTALACRADTEAFARAVFKADRAPSTCRADVLSLDGRPIAVGLILLHGRTGFAVKCCYDEEFRSFSPGLLLELDVVRSFLAEGWADRLDAGTAGSHVVDGLWDSRVTVGDLAFSLARRGAGRRLSLLDRGLRAHASAKRFAKVSLARMAALKASGSLRLHDLTTRRRRGGRSEP